MIQIDFSRLGEVYLGEAPEVLLLACALSAWPVIPYAALRQARQWLLPADGAWIELELCQSQLVAAQSYDGFTFNDAFRVAALDLLHESIAVRSVRDWLERIRGRLAPRFGALSPLLLEEAEIAWTYVIDEPSIADARIEAILRRVLWTGILGEKRSGVFSWVANARSRLPHDCIRGSAAWLLCQLCHARGLKMTPVTFPTEIDAQGLEKLVHDHLPTVVVGLLRTPTYIEVGVPTPDRSVGIVLVDTDPLILTVRDSGAPQDSASPRRLAVRRDEPLQFAVSRNEIVLGNLAGQTFTLARMRGEMSIEAMAAEEAIKKAELAKRMHMTFLATVVRPIEAGYVIHVPRPHLDATLYLPYMKEEFVAGDTVEVVIDEVLPSKRWISAKPAKVRSRAESGSRGFGVSIPIRAVDRRVRPGDRFPAVVLYHGKKRGERKSAHVFIEPTCLLGTSRRWYQSPHRPGHARFPQAVSEVNGKWVPAPGAIVEIEARGIHGQYWHFLLRSATDDVMANDVSLPIEYGHRVTATVVSVCRDGFSLESDEGHQIWMPAREAYATGDESHTVPRKVGERIVVRILGADSRGGTLSASYRAACEPYIDRLRVGESVTGQITRRLLSGEYLVLIEPIRAISRVHFHAQSTGSAQLDFPVGARVSATVSRVKMDLWLLLVSEVRIQPSDQMPAS